MVDRERKEESGRKGEPGAAGTDAPPTDDPEVDAYSATQLTPGIRRDSDSTETVEWPTAARAAEEDLGLGPDAPFGPYRIVRLLGRGGMGVVYEAEDTGSGRSVALKILTHVSLESDEARKRFLREGRLAASVSHPCSVYVYGTDEINGRPVISMELIDGGTLQDLVTTGGPVEPKEAVDIILQIISGLEAALAVGVMHRDIKPSNCFIDSNGAARVGDYGLSRSTTPGDESQLTMTGTFMGTPYYASPEQLKAEELDARADIYSVGATFFYLLTGRTAFEGDNLAALISEILSNEPRSVRSLRPDVPAGLSKVVGRCLEKDPAKRFGDYGALRDALLPFSSTASTAATLGLRFGAGVIDAILLAIIPFIGGMLFGGSQAIPIGGSQTSSSGLVVPWALQAGLMGAGALMEILYYWIAETTWGATAGKALTGLRVVSVDGGRVPRWRGLSRSAMFVFIPVVPWMVYLASRPGQDIVIDATLVIPDVLGVLFLLLLWSTMRHTNGFASVHDLASGTRVVRRVAQRRARPVLESHVSEATTEAAETTIGPYEIKGALVAASGEADLRVLLGYEQSLRRYVWIRTLPPGTAPISDERRDLARAARLRWITGRRDADECWDAYEVVDGRSFGDVVAAAHPWRAVRHWLVDLAEELLEGQRDGSVPENIGLDLVWITHNGRLRLLDFPVGGGAQESDREEPLDPADFGAMQAFLHRVALSALEGRLLSADEASGSVPAAPLPLHARDLLEALGNAGFDSRESLLHDLCESAGRAERITTWQRLGSIAVSAALPVLFGLAGLTFVVVASLALARLPDVVPLEESLEYLEELNEAEAQPGEPADVDVADLELYIAGRFGALVADPAVWDDPLAPVLVRRRLRIDAEEIMRRHPAPTSAEVSEAESRLAPMFEQFERESQARAFERYSIPLVVTLFALGMVSVFSLSTSLIFGSVLTLRLLGIVVVNADGSRAGRLRTLLRAVAVASPIIAVFGAVALLRVLTSGGSPARGMLVFAAFLTAAIVVLGAAIWAVLHPHRGLQDRLARTYLVRT